MARANNIGPYEVVAADRRGRHGRGVPRPRSTPGARSCNQNFGSSLHGSLEREARAIAALNHPNVCTLYDVGPDYLVMELVEGETLQGPLRLDVALNYARQIADALEAAHEKGIVHRDLKPANIKINRAGTVKVLDFGLASIARDPATDGATFTVSATSPGTILGTAAYMAPEQARGMTVDQRADIWSFGVVLCEMLTGAQPFRGETITDILASVVKDQPDLSA